MRSILHTAALVSKVTWCERLIGSNSNDMRIRLLECPCAGFLTDSVKCKVFIRHLRGPREGGYALQLEPEGFVLCICALDALWGRVVELYRLDLLSSC